MSSKRISRQSFIEEEIEVKPSTELTPDEYEHFQESAKKIEVHTFVSSEEGDLENSKIFLDMMQKCGIEVKQENKHNLENDNYNEVLDKICEQSNNQNGLIILFSGFSRREGYLEMFDGNRNEDVNIQEIWSKFNSYNCKALKNKPKIFIFEVAPKVTQVESDSSGKLLTTYELTYDTPAEADMLIVYHKPVDDDDEFIQSLCEMINDYGENEDIISLVTCLVSKNPRPMLISTLTRKFYFTASDVRGHHSVIDKNQKELVAHIKEVKETLDAKFHEKKEKRTFFGSFNFGKKSKEKREPSSAETEKAEPEPKLAATKTVADSTIRPPPPSTTRRPSVRTLSQSESESGRTSKRVTERDKTKPHWKP